MEDNKIYYDTKIILDEKKLRVKSDPVTAEEAVEIVEKLKQELLKHSDAIGLSAIQIGIPKRVFILRAKDGTIYSFINPEITDAYDRIVYPSEGCLSFPGKFVSTSRYNYVQIKDDEKTRILNGIMAVAAQHEYDHLEGELFFDRKYDGYRKTEKEVGRNEPCPCGSGKKYKKCCMK